MTIKYKHGFDFNGVLYGFKDKKLYRLPQMIGPRFYSKLEILLREEKRKSGNWKGYLLYQNKEKVWLRLKQ